MSYQREREQFIATMTHEGLPLSAVHALLRAATTINRLTELACSSEAADRDRIKCPAWHPIPGKSRNAVCLCDWPGWTARGEQHHHQKIPRITLQDHQAEQRARKALPTDWALQTSGDPRGYTLRVIPPSYAARNAGRDVHNLDAIGVPTGPSRLRW